MSVAYGSGTVFTGRRDAANRETEIRPETFQGPVPACLSGGSDCLKQPFPQHGKSGSHCPMPPPRKHVRSLGFPTREDKEAARKKAEREAAAALPAPLNPPCPECGGPTKKRGTYPTGETRFYCRGCGKSHGRSKPARAPGPPCPSCGGPSWGHGRSALGVPIRKCASPKCGKTWTTRKGTTKARNGFSSTRAAACRAAAARRTPEERSEIGKRAAATRLATQSFESRSLGSKKGRAGERPGKRVERAKKAAAALHALPEADRLARIAKGRETRRLKREAALAWLAEREGGG